jgi:hypothetical protein
MATTTTTETTNLTEYDVSNKDFSSRLTDISKSVDDLVELAVQVGGLEKGQRLQLPDGRQVGKRELRSAASQVVQTIRDLRKYHKAALRTKKRVSIDPATGEPIRRGGGFSLPIRVTDELKNFFATANLGPVDPSDPKSPSLSSQLFLLTQAGVTSPSLLTPLFSIYVNRNGLQDKEQRNILHCDDHMRKHLSNTLTRLQKEIQPHQSKPSKSGKPARMLPGFNPASFPYYYLQNIVQANKVSMTKDETAALASDTSVSTRLQQEQQLVSAILDSYREARAPEEKARRAEKNKLKRSTRA